MDVLHYVGRKLSRPAHAARVTRQYTHQVHYDSVDVYQGMEEDPRHNSAVEAASQRHRVRPLCLGSWKRATLEACLCMHVHTKTYGCSQY